MMNGQEMPLIGEPKVAVLKVPRAMWLAMSPQQQTLFLMQQLLGLMASEYFGTMDGVAFRVTDPDKVKGYHEVLQIGKSAVK